MTDSSPGGADERPPSSSEAAQSDDDAAAGCPSTEGMLELDDLRPLDAIPPSFDADEVDDEDGDSDGEGVSSSYHPPTRPRPASRTAYLLGRAFDRRLDRAAMASFQRSLYWFTYRNDLAVPLRPYAATSAQALVSNVAHGGGLGGVTGEGGMKSDAGWGCMLRSAQMMMAQAVRAHYANRGMCGTKNVGDSSSRAGRTTRHDSSRAGRFSATMNGDGKDVEHRRQSWRQLEDPWEVQRIATWFADFPNQADLDLGEDAQKSPFDEDDEFGRGGLTGHWYSLHQMVAAGLGLGVLPGEWYGPTTACHVLRELNEMHCRSRERTGKRRKKREGTERREGEEESDANGCDVFRVHVATEGCIYLDAIYRLVGGDTPAGNVHENDDAGDEDKVDPLSVPNDPTFDDPLQMPPPSSRQTNDNADKQSEPWGTSLLLLLPLRLGIRTISTSDYGSTLAKLLSFPQSVGMLGGTARHALWFYGADAAEVPGSEREGGAEPARPGWYGLDPHTVQPAPRGTRVLAGGGDGDGQPPRHRWRAQLTDTYLRSLHVSAASTHANHAGPLPLADLDPSCALGFYVRDGADLGRLRRSLEDLNEGHCRPHGLPTIVTAREHTPDYEGAVDAIGGVDGAGDATGVDLDRFSMKSEEEEDKIEDDDDDSFVLV